MTPHGSAESVAGELVEIRPGRRLHVASRNIDADTTLFFIHGGGGNKKQWRFQWRSCARANVNMVAWDAIGHGRSPRGTTAADYAGRALVADLDAVFARYRRGRNILVAHSYGARLALAWLLDKQARGQGGEVDTVILIGAAPLGAMGARLLPGWLGKLPLPILELIRPVLGRRFRKLAWHNSSDPELIQAEQRATRGNTLFMMQALMAGAPSIAVDRLAQLQHEFVVLAGSDDGLIPDALSAQLAASLPDARLVRVAHCGHQIMLEQPESVNAEISHALERRREKAAS